MPLSGSWEDAARSMQPQYPGSAPRAANPGTGGGNRAYAPGATMGHQFTPPRAGAMAPPNPNAYPGASRGGAPGTPPSDGPPPPMQAAAPGVMQQQVDPLYAQRFATNLIDALMRKVQMARQQRQSQGY